MRNWRRRDILGDFPRGYRPWAAADTLAAGHPIGSLTPLTSTPRTVVCTVISANYLARARVLMNSLRIHHPDWTQHVLVVDEIGDRFDSAGESFTVTEVSELPFESPRELFFRYDILELNTAVKPFFFRWLFDKQEADRVVYLDPDIEVYAPLDEVESALDDGALMCLTPHLTGIHDDDGKPSDLDILVAGSYNLGFLALARHANLYPFLEWWWEKLEFDCLVDFQRGLFVDQKWMDLAPGLFGDAHLIRAPGYNVAYWNLPHREVSAAGENYRVNGEALVFFHFSGLDPDSPSFFSKHQDRYTFKSLGPLQPLIRQYCKRVQAAGHKLTKDWSYAFDTFVDGEPILPQIRQGYRASPEMRIAAGNNPFELGIGFLNEPVTPPDSQVIVTRLAHLYWHTRPDLQSAFPSPTHYNAPGYAQWFVEEQESKIPAHLKDSMLASLRSVGTRVSPWKINLRTRIFRQAHKYSIYLKQWIPRRIYLAAKDRFFRWAGSPLMVTAKISSRTEAAKKLALARHSGFHSQDDYDLSTEEAWMGEEARIELASYPGGQLRVSGSHTAGEYAPHLDEIRLSVGIEANTISSQLIEHPGPFSVTFNLPKQEPKPTTLLLKASYSFIPEELGLNYDPRALSLRIGEISLDEEILAGFGKVTSDPSRKKAPSRYPPGYNIVGYFQQELGIAESARLSATAVQASTIPHSLVNFSKDCSSATGDHPHAKKLQTGNPYSINVFHINADQMPAVWLYFGSDFFHGRHNVGVWHWELPEFPDEWVSSFAYLDELWAPSRFIQDSVSAKSTVPVIHMPHAMEFERPKHLRRAEFGLPEDCFLFLTMYDMHSFQARKNPQAVLQSFKIASESLSSRKVGLVIKVMNTNSQPAEFSELEKWASEQSNVTLITQTFSRTDIYRLEACCDAFVSLHRSEGWGLGLAECMYLQKPVIGTAWSGNLDFMTPENSALIDFKLVPITQDHGPYKKGQSWAEPSVQHAAEWMVRLVEDKALRDQIASKGRRTIESDYSPRAIAHRYEERLRILQKGL